jgi:hypothetical protein
MNPRCTLLGRAPLALALPATLLACAASAQAGFTTYTNFDAWKSATGNSYTTLDFVFPQPVLLTTQYLSLGVSFPDQEEVAAPLPASFPFDGWGIWGAGFADSDIHLKFATPQKWIAAHYPGYVSYQLISNGTVIYTSPFHGTAGASDFHGVVSSVTFDEVRLINPLSELYVDNIYFGIPAPGTLALLGAGLIGGRRRRR